MAFIQDPRLRQRWNQISHNAEAVTENAAAGIWTFQHRYIHPCLAGLGNALDSCTSVCLGGDREERARRARERDRGARRTRAEYTFDFYDDWDDADDEGPGSGSGSGVLGRGLLGGWGGGRGEDWDRLLAGSGSAGGRSRHAASDDVLTDQPRRKRGMSYGTRGVTPGIRRKASGEEDPNVIPRTAPLGFLGRLPFKIGGTLRYKPSAANLQDNPGGPQTGSGGGHGHGEEREPLLGTSEDDEEDIHRHHQQHRPQRSPPSRPRSNTAQSGDTSSSYRSRGDLFPSDGEGDEDAVPLDDEFTMDLDHVENDRSSNKTRSSKGKRRADRDMMSRTVSRTTIDSGHTPDSLRRSSNHSPLPFPNFEDTVIISGHTPSLEDLEQEEAQAEREELEEIERRRRAASQLALQRGLSKEDLTALTAPSLLHEPKVEEGEADAPGYDRNESPHKPPSIPLLHGNSRASDQQKGGEEETKPPPAIAEDALPDVKIPHRAEDEEQFVPARLPYFR
ncbi:hypothetical protein B0H63DRAFT_245029 [Podospora didyma]|uniref:Uncharacterized protein n=1 Tax=Podospora didyma TaxID=330526 RepID=A0AAE0NCG3_9PEZI|nr:hypothetical protein B0H63DRAFT_245029 [Podospora didyma]